MRFRASVLVAVAVAVVAAGVLVSRAPASADLRETFAEYGLDVRLQGSRGTCSVFTVTDAVEYALARAGSPVRLSPEFLNWASNDAIAAQGDGGFFSDLWKGVALHGISPAREMPYQQAFDAELAPSESALAAASIVKDARLQLHWIKPWDVKTGLSDVQLVAIKDAIADGWPVLGGFRWPSQQRFDGRVLQMAPADGVYDGHSILLVGYRDDDAMPGGGVLLFRNTADGTDDQQMTYEYARAYMNDAAWVQ